MQVIILSQTIAEEHKFENELADVAQLKADVDYIAMMTGVEIHDKESEESE